ncbi:MAG: 50S ribosomal protein L33 [Mollicutes bacterium]|nr:MAG: 50S ribosomal protein L33 [Mollicutes bacterium]
MRIGIKLVCETCKTSNYFLNKNKTLNKDKLSLRKFCGNCRLIKIHKEKSIK